MISTRSQFLRHSIGTAALVAALIGFAASTPAAARVWIGFGFPGVYVGPPAYYYPPPAYYPPPPPAYYPGPMSYAPSYAPPPASSAPPSAGQTCYAGAYTCPMDQPVASGGACYCLGNGGARVWGRTN